VRKGSRKGHGWRIIGRGNVRREGFICIKYRNKLNGGWDMPKGVKKGGRRAPLLRGFEDIVGDVEGVVEINGEDPQVEMGDVEGGRGDEDFGGLHIGKGFKRVFVVRGIGEELHTLLTPIRKGWVAWSVQVSR
jgi:hypothetical protein